MVAPTPSTDGSRKIALDTLSLEELNQLKEQEENRLQSLTARYAQLRQAAARLNQSVKAVAQVKETAGMDILVPLTESVYVPGRIVEPDNLLVELGTGYFAERTGQETLGFFSRKMALVDANTENVSKMVMATRQNIMAVNSAMQGKMLEIRAKQEGARHRAAIENEG
jgi:prefoldin alpha subunit